MKNIFLLFSIVALLIASCKKDNSRPQEPLKNGQTVKFTVTPFTQQIINFEPDVKTSGLKTQSLSDNIKVLYIVIYNNNGTPIRTAKQTSTTSGFGEFEADLATGNYTVVFAGGQSGLQYNATSYNKDVLQYINSVNKATLFEDTFFKKSTLTVTSASQQNVAVTLKRIVGKLTLNLQAKVPAGAQYIAWTFLDKSAYSVANEAPATTALEDINSGGAFFVKPGDTIINKTLYVLNVGQPVKHRLYCNRQQENEYQPEIIYAEKQLTLQSEINKHITVSGSLFGTSAGNTGVEVDVDGNWNPQTNTYTF